MNLSPRSEVVITAGFHPVIAGSIPVGDAF